MEPLRPAEPPLPAAPHQRQAGLTPSPRADTIPPSPSSLASSPLPLPGGWGLECVSLTPQFPEPCSLFSAPLGSPGTKSPPRSSLLLRPLWRSRSNGLRTAVPHHTPLFTAQPEPRALRQRERASPSAPISFRRLSAPPAPQPLDCGRRKPLHERAPECARPAGRPRRRPDFGGGRGRGSALAAAAAVTRASLEPRTVARAWGRGWGRQRKGSVCSVAHA